MALKNLPLWPFEPNWDTPLVESLEWLTSILTSDTGAEQRRSLREYPRRGYDYATVTVGPERAFLDNLLVAHGASEWYMPIWHNVSFTNADGQVGASGLQCDEAAGANLVGISNAVIMGSDVFTYELVEVISVSSSTVVFKNQLQHAWPAGSRIMPVEAVRLIEQPEPVPSGPRVATTDVQFESTDSRGQSQSNSARVLIANNLVANAYHTSSKAPDEFERAGGTARAQFTMIVGLYRAYEQLVSGLDDERRSADYYRRLAEKLLDGLGEGNADGPMLRQGFPSSTSTLAMMNEHFAARDDVEVSGNRVAPAGEAYEISPEWRLLDPSIATCSPDVFQLAERALSMAIEHDDRPGAASKWSDLRLSLRRTQVRAHDITDQRDVFKPMPGFDAIPVSGPLDGMFCASNHPGAVGPSVVGADISWNGYDFWSRTASGAILGDIPAVDRPGISMVEIGRNFEDKWRFPETYQDGDKYLYVRTSASRKPNRDVGEYFLIRISTPTASYYADIGQHSNFTATTSGAYSFFIERDEFRQIQSFDDQIVWGNSLPNDSDIASFGVVSYMKTNRAYSIILDKLRLVSGPNKEWVDQNQAEAIKGVVMPYFPGCSPFKVSADLDRQILLDWTGLPFIGNQRPDQWWWLQGSVNALLPNLSANDLATTDRSTGAIEYVISSTTDGGAAKPKNALLAEQQLLFIKQAQEAYNQGGGPDGFFASTFVLNKASLRAEKFPTPHTWIYSADGIDPRLARYQTAVVESLAHLYWLSAGDAGFEDARDLAVLIGSKWLTRIDAVWPSLTAEEPVGMPTHFPNPSLSPPQTLYEDPYTVAQLLKACLIFKHGGWSNTSLADRLMRRCWDYLEYLWHDTGEMAFTWSTAPDGALWYGLWHGGILDALATMVEHSGSLPGEILEDVVQFRLHQAQSWMVNHGVNRIREVPGAALTDIHEGFYVMPRAPEERDTLRRGYERDIEEFDTRLRPPVWVDKADRAFTVQEFAWALIGRDQHNEFDALLSVLRGRTTPLWVPTFLEDFELSDPINGDSATIKVWNSGFAQTGGPKDDRTHIMIETVDGRYFRKIVSASQSGSKETLKLDRPLRIDIPTSEVLRICFMSLMRLNGDRVEIEHQTDNVGVSYAKVTMRSAPNIRQPKAAFYR